MDVIIRGEKEMTATRETVWQALNDPEVLRRCIPGCTALEQVGPSQLAATVSLAGAPPTYRATYGDAIESYADWVAAGYIPTEALGI